jgi:octaprenyl-diphosphate synthase
MLAAETRAVESLSPGAKPQSAFAWKQIAEEVEPFLESVATRLSAQIREFEPEIAEYAQYALTAQGKQLRPILVSLSADASGKTNDHHVTVAAIIEMVHLATLVHDDVIDEAQIRRGRPTSAANWGNEVSVLLGDCLFAHALKMAAGFPTTEICRAVAGATNTVCSGEIVQTQQRLNFEVSREEYFRVLAMKTGELFALSCDMGAYLAHASVSQREALRQFGLTLGTAYQIYDDCLDLFGLEAAAGKSLGTDLAKGKLTLPLLIVLERASLFEKRDLQAMIQNWNPASLPRVLQLLRKYDALNESRGVIHQYLESARQSLSILPLSSGRIALHGLTEYLAQQVHALNAEA